MMWDWAPWWHWLSMAVLWFAAIAVIASVVGWSFPPRATDGEARRILDDRLARGDLDVDEYRRLRQELDPRPPSRRRARA